MVNEMSLQITANSDMNKCQFGTDSISLNIDIQIGAKSIFIVASHSNTQLMALFIQSCSHALAQHLISAPKALQQ